MSDMVRLKPLEWELDGESEDGYQAWRAETIIGTLTVESSEGSSVWGYRVYENGEKNDVYGDRPCDSIEAGKLAAEAFYRERIAPAFEVAIIWRPIPVNGWGWDNSLGAFRVFGIGASWHWTLYPCGGGHENSPTFVSAEAAKLGAELRYRERIADPAHVSGKQVLEKFVPDYKPPLMVGDQEEGE